MTDFEIRWARGRRERFGRVVLELYHVPAPPGPGVPVATPGTRRVGTYATSASARTARAAVACEAGFRLRPVDVGRERFATGYGPPEEEGWLA